MSDENARNLELIRAAQASQPPSQPEAPPNANPSAKVLILEIAQRMVEVARKVPTPGVTDTYAYSRMLVNDAKSLMEIAEGL